MPWHKMLLRIEALVVQNPRRTIKDWLYLVSSGVAAILFAAIVGYGINTYIKSFIILGPPKGEPTRLGPKITKPLKPSPPVPLEKQVAFLDIQLTNILRLFGRNPATAQVCIRVVNLSSFEASKARFYFQHHDGGIWLGALTSWIACDWSQTLGIMPFPPGSRFLALLTSESREGVGPYLKGGGKLYFASRIEWENPNGKIGCLVRFVEISSVPSGAGPNARVNRLKLLSKLPNGLKLPDIGTPCPS